MNNRIKYAVIGVLFGLCFPLISFFLIDSPYLLFYVICLAPIILGIIASVIGKIHDSMEEKIVEESKKFIHASKLASIGEMSAGVGHEINNPLAISIGNINFIKKMLSSEEIENLKIFKCLDKVEIANARIRKIVDGLRTYARLDEDENEVISLNMAIEQTVDLISEIYSQDGISITVKTNESELFTIGNLGKLQQVIMNLISNAKDATEGRENREITISLKKENNTKLVFSVHDNGMGIPGKIKDKILNPFFTTKKLGKGTGIGLGVVSDIVKNMKGTIKIESIEGQGATFFVILPSVAVTNLKKKEEDIFLPGLLSGTALVVDDDKNVRELIVESLVKMGLLVDDACDGDEALSKVKLKKYNYICTDLKMDRIHGDEFIKESKKLSNGNTKYFIISGELLENYSMEKRKELLGLIDGCITKPFSEEALYDALSGSGSFKNCSLKKVS